MVENWNLNIGKFEWDKTDGEIRYSYCFTTENGLGYESFNAIVLTITRTGDKLWPELKALTDPSPHGQRCWSTSRNRRGICWGCSRSSATCKG